MQPVQHTDLLSSFEKRNYYKINKIFAKEKKIKICLFKNKLSIKKRTADK